MDFKDKKVIVERYNNSIRYIAEMAKSAFDGNRLAEIEKKRNAGGALVDAYEWAVKHHLFFHAKNVPFAWKADNFFKVPWKTLIDKIDSNDASPFNPDLPNFRVLGIDKLKARNISVHNGEEPFTENIYRLSDEVRKVILAYIDKDAILSQVEDYLDYNAMLWEKLYVTCNRFEPLDTNFILIVGDLQNQPLAYKKSLGVLPWSLILDLDPYSREGTGFFNSCYADNLVQPKIIKIADREVGPDFFPISNKSHFHYFIRGYQGDGANIDPSIKWNTWNSQNSHSLSDNFNRTFAAYINKYPSKSKIVILYDDIAYVSGICNFINRILGDRAEFIICNQSRRLFERIVDEDGLPGCHIPLTLSDISSGVALHKSDLISDVFLEDQFRLPHHKNTKTPNVDGVFTAEDFASLEEDLEVLHLDILKEDNPENRLDFLRGQMPLPWNSAGLKDPFDVPHPKLNSVLRDLLDKERKGTYYLKHEPGVGGSTFARRLAWKIHLEFPTVLLREYRDGDRVVKKLEKIYERTRERIYIFAEVPQSISTDELKELEIKLKAKPWTTILVAIGRDLPKSNSSFTNWGNDCIELITEFKKYLPTLGYSKDVIDRKNYELDQVYAGNDPTKKNPFYIGFLVSEEKFLAIDPYIKNFSDALKTREQKNIVLYLSIVQEYLGLSLPSVFFSKMLGLMESGDPLKLSDVLPKDFDHVLNSFAKGNVSYWMIRHPLFARKFKEGLLGSKSSEGGWRASLPDVCISFIEDSSLMGEQSAYIQEDILQPLFIGSRSQRGGNAFTQIVEEMNPEAQEAVFLKLADTYPNNAHYFSHLARFYAYKKKNSVKALEYADKAIYLSELEGRKDAILYHIRGMCMRQSAHMKMDEIRDAKKKGRPFSTEDKNEVLYTLVPSAANQFEEARKLQRNSEYGYVAQIQMLIEVIDFGHFLSGMTKAEFLSAELDPFAEWLDDAATLMEEVKRISIGDEGLENEKVVQCDEMLNSFYERYDLVIQNLNNQLIKGKNSGRIRRQISRFMMRKQPDYHKDSRMVNRIMDLMVDNIRDEPDREGNFFLWFQAARFSHLRISDAIDRMGRWKAKSTSLDASYYFYILKVIRALDGYSDEMVDAAKLIQESRLKSRSMPNNTYCHEWYGLHGEMRRIVNSKEISAGYFSEKCEWVRGRITSFLNDGNGKITLKDANLLEVFFNPSESKINEDHLNAEVEFYLGFSYDGLRAKEVVLAHSKGSRVSLSTSKF